MATPNPSVANTVWKVTFQFKCDDTGVSETWYAGTGTYDVIMNKAVIVAQARSKLLGVFASFDGIRVSDEFYRGDSMVSSQVAGLAGPNGNWITPAEDPAS